LHQACGHRLQRICIVLRENKSAFGTWHFSRGKRAETVKVDGALSSNDGGVALHWVLEGRGIVVRSKWEVEGHLAHGELVTLLDDWALPDANIHAIYLERNQLSVKLRTFVNAAARHAVSVTHTPCRASYFHFEPSVSSPAFLRSSATITTRNSQSALNVRNHGSANFGICDGSSRFTTRIAPRVPFCSVK
jgi:hypothetical protein